LCNQSLSLDVGEQVDRIRFRVVAADSAPVLVAHPELMHVPPETAGTAGGGRCRLQPEPSVRPNPARIGESLDIVLGEAGGVVKVYDVRGRCMATAYPRAGQERVAIDTGGFAPGLLFVKHLARRGGSGKVVVYR
jgi:hypothetical protein